SHSLVTGGVKVAIAQLTKVAGAPRPDRSIGLERQAVPTASHPAGSNRHDAAQTAYLDRRSHSLVSGRVKVAIAQLALIAVAPGPYCAVGLECQAVRSATSNRCDASQTAYLNRRSHSAIAVSEIGVKVAIAQLAVVAASPSPYCAVGLECQAVVPAASNCRDTSQINHVNRCGHSWVSGGVKVAITQPARTPASPVPYCAVRFERQAVRLTASNRRDRSQTVYLNRYSQREWEIRVKVAVAQLARGAGAPSPYCAVGI